MEDEEGFPDEGEEEAVEAEEIDESSEDDDDNPVDQAFNKGYKDADSEE